MNAFQCVSPPGVDGHPCQPAKNSYFLSSDANGIAMRGALMRNGSIQNIASLRASPIGEPPNSTHYAVRPSFPTESFEHAENFKCVTRNARANVVLPSQMQAQASPVLPHGPKPLMPKASMVDLGGKIVPLRHQQGHSNNAEAPMPSDNIGDNAVPPKWCEDGQTQKQAYDQHVVTPDKNADVIMTALTMRKGGSALLQPGIEPLQVKDQEVIVPKMGIRYEAVSPSGEGDDKQNQEAPPIVSFDSKRLNDGSTKPAVDFNDSEHKTKGAEDVAQHHVFNWLNWAPEPKSSCYEALHANFPGALPGKAMFFRAKAVLEERFGLDRHNTLFGASICPDEINHEKGGLADLMKEHFGECFELGGISGAPFVGASGFNAFSAHAPDDGNIVILFGPHIAVTKSGEVGKYLRGGQHHHSTACGAVIGAYHACLKGRTSTQSEAQRIMTFSETDMQMDWLKQQIQPHVASIVNSTCPLAALTYQAYEIVKTKLLNIANTDFGCGKLVLLGGIQINMPRPYEDHFLPLMFDVHRHAHPAEDILRSIHPNIPNSVCLMVEPTFKSESDVQGSDESLDAGSRKVDKIHGRRSSKVFEGGEALAPAKLDRRAEQIDDAKHVKSHHLYAWLNWGPQPDTPCYKILHKYFPGAIPGPAVHARTASFLASEYGFRPENTLFGMSICPDEINNRKGSLTNLMSEHWGEFFPLGGISGAPFVGKTGFGAFSHHVPDNGNILLVFGPHVGISKEGEVGKYLREGQGHCSTACGAVIGAYNACCAHDDSQDVEFDETDMQMGWIKSRIAPHVERLKIQENPMAELAYQAFEMVNAQIKKIVNTDFGTGYLVLVGGIQLNMPEPCRDHFLPLVCEVRRKDSRPQDIMNAFNLHVPNEGQEYPHILEVAEKNTK